MKTTNKQKGMSLIGFFVMLTLIGLVAGAAVKIGPIYMEYMTVTSIMKELQGDRALAGKGKKAIRSRLSKGFSINQIERVKASQAKITSTKNGYLVDLKYEVRFPIVGNLEGIASFNPQANVNNP
ncbi:MAG: DUF4845 domain-containing protein [Gammaproteobacteria bacterium]|nr:MAG: DUF4845 domain-containing protein [Gammaproteobacteria bacterium]